MRMSREQFLATSGMEVHKLEFWLEQKWLIAEPTEAGTIFTDRDVARAHFIRDLETDFGVNQEGIDIILHLVDQLHGMRRAFARAQADLTDRSPPSASPTQGSE